MYFAFFIQQIAFHCGITDFAATLVHQAAALCLIVFVSTNDFITRNEVQCLCATLFRRKAVTRTTKEYPCRTRTNLHVATAGRTFDVSIDRVIRAHSVFTASFLELVGKVAVEVIQNAFPVSFTIGNFIQLFFHGGSEAVIHQIGEVFGQAAGDNIAHFFSVEASAFQADVTAILNGRNNRRIGRRATDTSFFKLFHQRRFREPRCRLGKMLLWFKLLQSENITFLNIGQKHIIIAFAAHWWQHFQMAVETDHTALGTQFVVAGVNRYSGAGKFGIVRLTGNKTAPDQVIQAFSVWFHGRQVTRTQFHIRRANRFVRFLCAFFAAVLAWVVRKILGTQFVGDVITYARHCVLTEVRRVSTHVGDVTSFIQALSESHRLFNTVPQAGTCSLLQRRGNKRRSRTRTGWFVFALGDLKRAFTDNIEC